MESKDFFGAPDPEQQWTAPSVLSVVVDACVEEFRHVYFPLANGRFQIVAPVPSDYVIEESAVASDVRSWVKELQGGSDVGDKIVALVKGNPGWEQVIAGRVIRKLRSSNGTE